MSAIAEVLVTVLTYTESYYKVITNHVWTQRISLGHKKWWSAWELSQTHNAILSFVLCHIENPEFISNIWGMEKMQVVARCWKMCLK